MNWQPIETAPKNGTVLVSTPIRELGSERMRQTVHTAWWRADIGRWRSGFGDLLEPTHWMPLPDPPADVVAMKGRGR